MTTDSMTTPAPGRGQQGWLHRLCARLGGWCDLLLDTHHARIPF
jgi:hypothetical protein